MIEDALRYQTQGDDWVKRVALGGVVLFFGFFIVPLFTFQGYMLEVMRRVLRGETDTPPAWGDLDLVDLTVDGLRHSLVVLGYGLVLLLLLAVPGLLLVGGGLSESSGLLLAGFLIIGLLYLAGTLAMAVVLPIATGNFVRTDSISGGFEFGVVRTLSTNRTMLLAVVMAFGVNILISTGATVLGFTLVGYLAVPFLAFVGQSAIMYVWARGFADAYEEAYGDPPLTSTVTPGATDTASTTATGTTGGSNDLTTDSFGTHRQQDGSDDTGFGSSAWDDAGDESRR